MKVKTRAGNIDFGILTSIRISSVSSEFSHGLKQKHSSKKANTQGTRNHEILRDVLPQLGNKKHTKLVATSHLKNVPQHIPVMLHEVLNFLDPRPNELYIDSTFGAGGYSKAILESCKCHVIAIDCDPRSIETYGLELERRYKGNLRVIRSQFSSMKEVLAFQGINTVHGVVFDLGLSSLQLDTPKRGFSFRFTGPLDMRMDLKGPTASNILDTLSFHDLTKVIFSYGEEWFAKKITGNIVRKNRMKRTETTEDLANLIRTVVPRRKHDLDPATRVFQALRIFVNNELTELQRALNHVEKILAPGGRLIIVSFHSLEDRIVKTFLTLRSREIKIEGIPKIGLEKSREVTFILPLQRVLRPSLKEVSSNPRSRSAKLRAAIRTSGTVHEVT